MDSLVRDRYVCTQYDKSGYYSVDEGELYDLGNDPLQWENRWRDPAFARLKADLLAVWSAIIRDLVLFAHFSTMPDSNYDNISARVESVPKDVGSGTECREHFSSTSVVAHAATNLRKLFEPVLSIYSDDISA